MEFIDYKRVYVFYGYMQPLLYMAYLK